MDSSSAGVEATGEAGDEAAVEEGGEVAAAGIAGGEAGGGGGGDMAGIVVARFWIWRERESPAGMASSLEASVHLGSSSSGRCCAQCF